MNNNQIDRWNAETLLNVVNIALQPVLRFGFRAVAERIIDDV